MVNLEEGNRQLLHPLTAAIVIIALCLVGIEAQSYTDADNLVTTVLAGYNRKVRPLTDQSQVLSVSVTLQPAAITEFDFVKEILHTTAIVKMSWFDEKITWTPGSYGNLDKLLLPQSDVWAPPAILVNPATDVDLIGQNWMNVLYNSSGYATYEPGALLESTCSLDVTHWPFDQQTCDVIFAPLGYHSTDVVFTAGIVDKIYYGENGEWEITSTSSKSVILGQTSAVYFTFDLRRRPTFLIVNLLLPVIFLMALSVCVFLLPPESGERVGYSITVLLSISVFFTVINDFIPSTSQPMATVTYYIMVNFVISTLICFGTIFSLKLHTKPQTAPAPKWCNKIARMLRRTKKNEVGVTETNGQEQMFSEQRKQPEETLYSETKSQFEPQVAQCPETELTWEQLRGIVDKILFSVFSLVTLAFTMWFMIDMATGA